MRTVSLFDFLSSVRRSALPASLRIIEQLVSTVLAATALLAGTAKGQVPELTLAAPYSQNFAAFASATNLTDARALLPPGWSVSAPVLSYNGTFGAGSTGGFRGNANVLGYQHSATASTLVKTLTLVNATGSPLTAVTLSYTGRAGRLNDPQVGRTPGYTLMVAGIEVPQLAYSTISGDNFRCHSGVSGLSIAAGGSFTITWSSDRGSGSGSSLQIGLSDVIVAVGTTLPTVSDVSYPVIPAAACLST